jgi:hypothetical protein
MPWLSSANSIPIATNTLRIEWMDERGKTSPVASTGRTQIKWIEDVCFGLTSMNDDDDRPLRTILPHSYLWNTSTHLIRHSNLSLDAEVTKLSVDRRPPSVDFAPPDQSVRRQVGDGQHQGPCLVMVIEASICRTIDEACGGEVA